MLFHPGRQAILETQICSQCAMAAARPMPVLERTYNSPHMSSARRSRCRSEPISTTRKPSGIEVRPGFSDQTRAFPDQRSMWYRRQVFDRGFGGRMVPGCLFHRGPVERRARNCLLPAMGVHCRSRTFRGLYARVPPSEKSRASRLCRLRA